MATMENREAEAAALVEFFRAHDPFTVLAHLSQDDFTTDRNRKAFEAMRERVESGVKIRADVEVAQLVAPIQAEADAMMRDSSGLAVVKTLKKLTQRRKLYTALMKSFDLVGDYSVDPKKALELTLAEIEEARDERVAGGALRSFDDITKAMVGRFDEAMKQAGSDGKPVGFGTGIPPLDNLCRFKRGNFIVLAGRAGAGKTAMALSMGRGMVESDTRVCYLCREMKDVDLAQRIAAQLSGENGRNFDQGKLTVTMGEFRHAVGTMIEYGDRFVVGQPKTLGDCMQMMQKARDKYGSEVFFVDYLQQLRVARSDNKRDAVMRITDACKFFALENNVTVVGLAQLNREAVKSATGKPVRPRVHHLQESSALEQDADMVFLLWNPIGEDKGNLKEAGEGEIRVTCDITGHKVAVDELQSNFDRRVALFCDKYRGGEPFRAVLGYSGPRTLFYPEDRYYDVEA